MDKAYLLERGTALMKIFCERNAIGMPLVERRQPPDWPFDVCAYYRLGYIRICLDKCARIGLAGASWSYPGYTVDRTPYGVLLHELGHHVDVLHSERKGSYFGDYSKSVRSVAGEEPITSYCPNDGEWFAEMFRVFVTNPDLLRRLRPRTYDKLRARFEPVFTDTWHERLRGAPERTINAAMRKIEQVKGRS